MRICCALGTDLKIVLIPFYKNTAITSIKQLNSHVYFGKKNEKNGIIYTQKGGFIDIGHVRDCADWTAFLYNMISANQDKNNFSIKLKSESGTKKTVKLKNLNNLDPLKIPELAGEIAYKISVLHEILTWFNHIIPQKFSSFSPEDLYSNLLGTKIGILAIKSDLEYNESVTKILQNLLKDMDVVSTYEETYDALQEVKGIWWNPKKRLPSKKALIARHLGSEESKITPWLIPSKNHLEPILLTQSDPKLSNFYELTIQISHRLPYNGSIGSKKSDRIITQNDFDWYINYIRSEINAMQSKEKKGSSLKRILAF